MSDQLLELALNSVQSFALAELSSFSAGYHYYVRSRIETLNELINGAAKQSLDLVALDCATNFARHTEPKAWAFLQLSAVGAREQMEHEVPATKRAPLAIDTLEVSAAREPARAPARCARCGIHAYTVSRLRPLSRRRLSKARPARVLILPRNPWARARLRFFGW